MSRRFSLGLSLIALALGLASGMASAKSLEECPILNFLAGTTGGRSSRLPPESNPVARVGRGAQAILLSPLDLPATIIYTTRSRGLITGMTTGVIQGTLYSFSRFAAGSLDVITAPFPGADLPPYTRRFGRPSRRAPASRAVLYTGPRMRTRTR